MGGRPRRRGWYRVEVEADQTEASRAIQNAAGDVQGTADCRILSCIECRSEKPFTGIIGSARKEMGRPDGEESTAAGRFTRCNCEKTLDGGRWQHRRRRGMGERPRRM